MTHDSSITEETQHLYLDRHGNLYQTPFDRADLERALRFQRRLTAHLVRVVRFLAASKGGTR